MTIKLDEVNKLADINDIANWFLTKGPMTNKKLQKLCYYAQAWSLVFLDAPISKNARFQAWVHGPVNTTLWKRFKDWNWQEFKLEDPESVENEILSKIDEDRTRVLETVWKTYGKYSADQLEILSHREEPWIEKREGLGKFESTTRLISEKTMKKYYQSING